MDVPSEASSAVRRSLRESWQKLSQEFAEGWFSSAQPRLFDQVDRELVTLSALRADVTAQAAAQLLPVLTRLTPYWNVRGMGHEAIEWMTTALTAARPLVNREQLFRTSVAQARLTFDTAVPVAPDGYLALAEETVNTDAEGARLAQLRGMCFLYDHEANEAFVYLQAAQEYHSRSGAPYDRFTNLSLLSVAATNLDDQSAAYEYSRQAISLCDEVGERLMRNYAVWALALAAWRDGDHRRAFAIAYDGVANAYTVRDHHTFATCAEILAWYSAHAARPETAAQLLGISEAFRLDRKLPQPYFGTDEFHRACVDSVLEALGPDRFRSAVFRGREQSLSEAARWIRTLGDADAAPTESDRTVLALTKRQQEIAELVALGLTNKEIARRLHISFRTVETHIEHVFQKLGVVSRSQIAAWIAADDE